MNNVDDLVEKFNNLSIQQRRAFLNRINENDREVITTAQEIATGTNSTTTRIPERNHPNQIQSNSARRTDIEKTYISANGIEIEVGDEVVILNSRKTGKEGDQGTVVKINKKYVAVKLRKNKSVTQRAGKNLVVITST